MSILTDLLQRELKLAEAQLSELDGPLAAIARRHVHEALGCVKTMARLEERVHVIGRREAA